MGSRESSTYTYDSVRRRVVAILDEVAQGHLNSMYAWVRSHLHKLALEELASV